jgi:hypothetical protein
MDTMHILIQLVSGAIIMGNLVISLFFLRFWRKSRDRLFAYFSLAFFVFAAQRVALALTTQYIENTSFLYLFRLAGFALILVAILDKNRR